MGIPARSRKTPRHLRSSRSGAAQGQVRSKPPQVLAALPAVLIPGGIVLLATLKESFSIVDTLAIESAAWVIRVVAVAATLSLALLWIFRNRILR